MTATNKTIPPTTFAQPLATSPSTPKLHLEKDLPPPPPPSKHSKLHQTPYARTNQPLPAPPPYGLAYLYSQYPHLLPDYPNKLPTSPVSPASSRSIPLSPRSQFFRPPFPFTQHITVAFTSYRVLSAKYQFYGGATKQWMPLDKSKQCIDAAEYLQRNAVAKRQCDEALKMVLALLRARAEEELGRALWDCEVDELGWELLGLWD